jgi:hypothetical protein
VKFWTRMSRCRTMNQLRYGVVSVIGLAGLWAYLGGHMTTHSRRLRHTLVLLATGIINLKYSHVNVAATSVAVTLNSHGSFIYLSYAALR